MRRPFFLFVIAFFSYHLCIGQVSYDTSLLNLLLSDTARYKHFKTRTALVWDVKAKNPGNAILMDGTLYFMPDQHGAVFRVDRSGDSLKAKRLDNTIYSGHNTHQYCFMDDGKIFGFGGYGFWRTNGQLRIYLEDKHEWDLVRLDQEQHSLNEFTYYDPNTRTLWCCKQTFVNDAIDGQGYSNTAWTVFRRKLTDNNWESVGDFFLKAASPSIYYRKICETPFGPLALTEGPKFQILDLERNKRYDLGALNDSLVLYNKYQPVETSIYSINDNIIMFDEKDNNGEPKSFRLTKDMLIDTNLPVYSPSPFLSRMQLIWAALLIFFVAAGSMMAYRRWIRPKSQKDPFNEHPHPSKPNQQITLIESTPHAETTSSFLDTLSIIEQDVVNQIRKDNLAGLGTRTELINKILGTDRKSPDIQKKQRSDVLQSINSKFRLFYRTDSNLIETRRSELDRRLSEYYIAEQSLGIFSPTDQAT